MRFGPHQRYILSHNPHVRIQTSSGKEFFLFVLASKSKNENIEKDYKPFIAFGKRIYEVEHEFSAIATGCTLNIQYGYQRFFGHISKSLSTSDPIVNISLVMPRSKKIKSYRKFAGVKKPVFLLPLTTIMAKQKDGTFYRLSSSIRFNTNFCQIRQIGGKTIHGFVSAISPSPMLGKLWQFTYLPFESPEQVEITADSVVQVIVDLNPDTYPTF